MPTLPLHIEPLKQGGCIAYLLACPATREALLIDPKLEDVPRYLKALENYGYALKAVLDTHGHADHVTAAPALVERTGCAMWRHHAATAPCITQGLKEGDTLVLGEHTLQVHETPGHTPEHIVVHIPGGVFTGDTLLLKTCGRTDFPGGDARALWKSLMRLAALPDDTAVYPGHDYRGLTFLTMAEVKRINDRLKLPDENAFVEAMANLGLDLPEKLQESLAAARHCSWQEYAEQQGIVLDPA